MKELLRIPDPSLVCTVTVTSTSRYPSSVTSTSIAASHSHTKPEGCLSDRDMVTAVSIQTEINITTIRCSIIYIGRGNSHYIH